jgi:hypothetical protein
LSRSGQLEDVLTPILFAPRPANPTSLDERVERSPGKGRVGRRGAREIGLRNPAVSADVAEKLRLRAPDLERRVGLRRGCP